MSKKGGGLNMGFYFLSFRSNARNLFKQRTIEVLRVSA